MLWKQCLARDREVEGGQWMKQKHDEKTREKNNRGADFEIASCQLCLLYFKSHYLAGAFLEMVVYQLL